MKEIRLTGKLVTKVDDEDFKKLSKFKWNLVHGKGKRYAETRFKEKGKIKYLKMHRLILNAHPGLQVDHIDGDGLNNQKKNLRLCTHTENARNRKMRGDRKFVGTKIQKNGRFLARISLNKKMLYLGTFDTEEDAALAYNRAAKDLYGEFASLNKLSRICSHKHCAKCCPQNS